MYSDQMCNFRPQNGQALSTSSPSVHLTLLLPFHNPVAPWLWPAAMLESRALLPPFMERFLCSLSQAVSTMGGLLRERPPLAMYLYISTLIPSFLLQFFVNVSVSSFSW